MDIDQFGTAIFKDIFRFAVTIQGSHRHGKLLEFEDTP